MKNRTQISLIVRTCLVLSLALAIWCPAQAQPAKPAEGKRMMDAKMMGGGMTDSCQEMMEQREKMMKEMKAQDAALTERVVKMNSAPEDKKIALMADIVTRMVKQRSAMHVQMEKMQTRTMRHMAGHMQMGMESMSQCPMMKGMDRKPVTENKESRKRQK